MTGGGGRVCSNIQDQIFYATSVTPTTSRTYCQNTFVHVSVRWQKMLTADVLYVVHKLTVNVSV